MRNAKIRHAKKEYDKQYNLKNKERLIKYRLKNKEIISERGKNYRLNNKERIKEQRKQYYLNNKEYIKEKGKEYILKNEETFKKYQKEYRLKNKERVKEYNKKWRLKNREHEKQYYLNNKKHITKVRLKWDAEQKKNNPNYRLKGALRRRVYSALKGKNKSASTMKLIGCSVDKLWNHLESKFESWMTKENYGLWHVDHIVPCASFNLTCPEQQRICFNYKNLQPLEAIENIKKGNKILYG